MLTLSTRKRLSDTGWELPYKIDGVIVRDFETNL